MGAQSSAELSYKTNKNKISFSRKKADIVLSSNDKERLGDSSVLKKKQRSRTFFTSTCKEKTLSQKNGTTARMLDQNISKIHAIENTLQYTLADYSQKQSTGNPEKKEVPLLSNDLQTQLNSPHVPKSNYKKNMDAPTKRDSNVETELIVPEPFIRTLTWSAVRVDQSNGNTKVVNKVCLKVPSKSNDYEAGIKRASPRQRKKWPRPKSDSLLGETDVTTSSYPIVFLRESRRTLPSKLQKKLDFERERERRSSYRNNPLSVEMFFKTKHFEKVPLCFPLNETVVVKLIPQFTVLANTDSQEIKHILTVRITALSRKEIAKTGYQFNVGLHFSEGLLRYYEDNGSIKKRFLRAHVWVGMSQLVDFDDYKLSLTGTFLPPHSHAPSSVEYDLELHHNYKNVKSADTGRKLLAVGVFQIRDSKQIINPKGFKWQAAVENNFGMDLEKWKEGEYCK